MRNKKIKYPYVFLISLNPSEHFDMDQSEFTCKRLGAISVVLKSQALEFDARASDSCSSTH